MEIETMKLWNVISQHPLGHRMDIQPLYVVASDIKYATMAVSKRIRYFRLELMEEMTPTYSNMVGLLYARYLEIKDMDISPSIDGDRKPVYFESVLRYNNDIHLRSTWKRHSHIFTNKVTLAEYINENRDRSIIIDLVNDRLKIRRKLIEKENIILDEYENKLKNINLLPIND